MKLNNGKIKLNEKISNMKYICIYIYEQFETIRSLGDNIYTWKISIDEAEMDQSNLLEKMTEFNTNARPKERSWRKIDKYFW